MPRAATTQISGPPLAILGALRIQAAEACEVVHGSESPMRSSRPRSGCATPLRYAIGPEASNGVRPRGIEWFRERTAVEAVHAVDERLRLVGIDRFVFLRWRARRILNPLWLVGTELVRGVGIGNNSGLAQWKGKLWGLSGVRVGWIGRVRHHSAPGPSGIRDGYAPELLCNSNARWRPSFDSPSDR